MSITSKSRFNIIAASLIFILVGLVIFLSLEVVKLKDVRQNISTDPTDDLIDTSKVPITPFDFTVDFFGMKYQGNSGNVIDSHILHFGAYEKDILYFMRDAMVNTGSTDGIFVDIGANTGQHSLFMSNYADVVHAFEPYQPVLDKFNALVELNTIDNIVIHPVGLGDKEEKITFYEPPESNMGTGTFVQSYLEDKTKGSELQIVTGDAALNGIDRSKINMIKMDIEGYEKPALKGLRNTLEVARPFVVFEITIDPKIDDFFNSMDEILASFPDNYRLVAFVQDFQTAKDGNYQFTRFKPDFNIQSHYNLVAYPQEKLTIPLQE